MLFSCSDCLVTGTLDATTTAELLALYQEWHRLTAAKVSKNQVSYFYNSQCWVTGCLPLSICWFKEWKGPKLYISFYIMTVVLMGTVQSVLGFHFLWVETGRNRIQDRCCRSSGNETVAATQLLSISDEDQCCAPPRWYILHFQLSHLFSIMFFITYLQDLGNRKVHQLYSLVVPWRIARNWWVLDLYAVDVPLLCHFL